MTLLNLPSELLEAIFCQLSPSSLASVSLVSRDWRTHAFPHLYHTVYLCFAIHLEELALRMISEYDASPFPVTSHVKELVLDAEFLQTEDMEEYLEEDEDEAVRITEGHMDCLKILASRLTRIQSLSWKLLFIPEDMDIFDTFRAQCPSLRSVHVMMERDFFIGSEGYLSLLPFTNLTELSFSAMDIPWDFDEYFAEPFPRILALSPNLNTLKLDFESKSGEKRYNPDILIAALGDKQSFPHLHTFHVRGHATTDWYEFFTYPESETHPLRQFIARNPGICDLALGNVPGGRLYDQTIPPEELAQLFPSVVYFEGPTFLLCRLVVSSIASQLESLSLNKFELCVYEDAGPLGELRDKISLPNLRKFAILAWECAESVHRDILETIISAAPRLEEIEAKDNQGFEENDILNKISGASRLRKLAISLFYVPSADLFETTDAELASYTAKLACAFPRLEIVKYGEMFTRERACTVLRTRVSHPY
ncbi:hypothetical protein RSOLAG22IIIB_08317 [Rhizoctonia solani]|uniref:F-box domain-containing protein n=1 Tax=Rhizoctonia solani TaxID=456999 RepID=A0A0K6FSW7_9AGAM|nr:hypothetical protein RSOLAG22IIIB_08317 [Rhizoctonia solani]